MNKKYILNFIFGFLVVFLTAYFSLLENIDNYFYDKLMYFSLENKKVSNEIVIIGVDKETTKYFGESGNWTRSRYEGLLEEIQKENPKVIVFDYFFSNKSIPDNFDWDLLEKISGLKTENIDEIYNKYQNEIYNKNYISNIDKDLGNKINKNIVFPYSYKINDKGEITNKTEISTFEIISKNASLGYVNIPLNNDGIVRNRTQNINNSKSISHKTSEIYIGKEIKIDNNFYINFYSKPFDKYKVIQFHNAYNGKFFDYNGNKINLKDKIVLIGDYHESLGDVYKTPVSKNSLMPGVEIIANEIQTILQNENIKKLNLYTLIGISLILFSLSFIIFYKIPKIFYLFASYVLSIFILFYVINILYDKYLIYLNIIYFIFSISISFLFILNQKIQKIYTDKLKIKKEFSRYLGKKLTETILSSDETKSKIENISVLFLDIEGFTTISEKTNNHDLIKITNKIFSKFNEIIIKNNGIIDKYIGDSVMVFWNSPNHEYDASKCAIELYDSLIDLNKKLNIDINIRIGINSGKAIVGNVGDENFSDYTVIGDTVNLASRLEGINKYYGTRILVSKETYLKVKDDFIFREIDKIKVKGKDNETIIYELNKNLNIELINNHTKALEYYYNKEFDLAIEHFNENKINFEDKVAIIFINRIAEFKNKNFTPENMIYEFKEK